MLTQLHVRTECSFKRAYGKIERVVEQLKELGVKQAGIVDTGGTWGHVRWAKACEKHGVAALFGNEAVIKTEDERKPVCWYLAYPDKVKEFYNFSSSDPTTIEDFIAAKGQVVRFAGAALLENPDAYDYIDITPRSVNEARHRLECAAKYNKPIVLISDNDYARPEDRDNFLAWDDSKRTTSQNILSRSEAEDAFWFLSKADFDAALSNTESLGERLAGGLLDSAPIISLDGDLQKLVAEGRNYRLEAGHIGDWTDVYEARLQRELELIALKEYESYFICVADLVKWAKGKMLVGPARGSSAGSLVCYLLEITEVDPIPYGLLFERFIDINRNDLPDIDIDFSDTKRRMVFDYLVEKYGAPNVAHIGTMQTLKARSVMAHVRKKMGINAGATFNVLNVLIEYSSGDARYGKGLEDTLANTQPGREFTDKYPEADVMCDLENHASHTGVHAAGIIVCNLPVIDYCTVRDGVAQLDKKDAEVLNLLKIDALGLRTLGVIEDTGCITTQQLYDMKLDDPEVLGIFDQAKFCGLFQFEGAAQRRVSVQVPMVDFKKIDHVTALARPGPLGGGAANHYINRNAGSEEITYRHESMAEYLGETNGVVLYQEQVMRIVREIGGFSWEDTSAIRKAMSGRKGKEYFDQRGKMFAEGAARLGITTEESAEIWYEICSFGAWGMNKSHTTSYAVISYWCAYMKRYHPIEYAAACLRNAKDDEQIIEFLREMRDEGIPYVAFDPERSGINWEARDGVLYGGFTNLHGIGGVKAAAWVKKRDKNGLSEDDLTKLAKHKPKHQDLSPAHTMWSDIYDNPENYNIYGRVKQFNELEDFQEAVVIFKMIRVDRRDQNEAVRVARRDGKRVEGQSLFLDIFGVDDSVSKPVLIRIKEPMWDSHGEKLADRAVAGEDWFLVRGKWLKQFSMMIVKKIKCLTNEEMFS